jgi:hypothetical protein
MKKSTQVPEVFHPFGIGESRDLFTVFKDFTLQDFEETWQEHIPRYTYKWSLL